MSQLFPCSADPDDKDAMAAASSGAGAEADFRPMLLQPIVSAMMRQKFAIFLRLGFRRPVRKRQNLAGNITCPLACQHDIRLSPRPAAPDPDRKIAQEKTEGICSIRPTAFLSSSMLPPRFSTKHTP